MRALSRAMRRDPGYAAALLDAARPSRARPTPQDLLAASDATGIPVAELFELLWGIPRSRLAAELGLDAPVRIAGVFRGLSPAERTEVADFAEFLAPRRAAALS
jgi:hypothetical protein